MALTSFTRWSCLTVYSLALVADAGHTVYHARVTQIESSGVAGDVVLFVPSGATSGMLLGTGRVAGLEKSVASQDCAGNANACGAHVHKGDACADAEAQGDHFFSGATDPWTAGKYSATDAEGVAKFNFELTIDSYDFEGKPFIIHNKAGARVACGLIKKPTTGTTIVDLKGLTGSEAVSGHATISRFTSDGLTLIAGAVDGNGLEKDLSADQCTAQNCRGAHVHEGTSCDDASSQGGHYFTGDDDPWTAIGYSKTDPEGAATFAFILSGEIDDVMGKAFVIHDDDGDRVACGLLAEPKDVEGALIDGGLTTGFSLGALAMTLVSVAAFGFSGKA